MMCSRRSRCHHSQMRSLPRIGGGITGLGVICDGYFRANDSTPRVRINSIEKLKLSGANP